MKKGKWWRKFFLSYVFVALIPVIVMACFFYYGNRLSWYEEIENKNYTAMGQVINKLDYIKEKMDGMAYHISGYDFGESFETNDRILKEELEVKLTQQLKTYTENIEGIRAYTVFYVRGDKYIYTEAGKLSYLEFEKTIDEYGILDRSSFFSNINALRYNTSVKIHQNAENQTENSMTFYLYPVPYMSSLPMATLGIGFGNEDIFELVKNYVGSMKANIYITNEHFQNIFSSEKGDFSENENQRLESLSKTLKGTGVFKETIDGQDYVVMRAVSPNSGFTIIMVSSEKNFYNRDDKFEKVFILLSFLMLLTGLGLAFYLSRINYVPIQNLLRKIQINNEETPPISHMNEFELIQGYWEDIQNRSQELYSLLCRQRPLVVASCLKSLLKGRTNGKKELITMLQSANINFVFPYFFAILIPLPSSLNKEEDHSQEILFHVHNAANAYGHLYGVDLLRDNGIAVIVNCREKEENGVDIRLIIGRHIINEINQCDNIHIQLYAGRIYETIEEISTSFMEASAAASEYSFGKEDTIILFEQIAEKEENTEFPILEQALYIQCIKQANTGEALKALEKMVDDIRALNSFLISQCLCNDIINLLIKTVNQINGLESQSLDLKELCTFHDVEEFYEKSKKATISICEQYGSYRTLKNKEQKSEMLRYVNDHYSQQTISLDVLAGQFNLSANYVSRFFKQETGCSFIQYITMLRMDKARELLLNTDLPIKDIVVQIGYIDVANFVRKFKAYEGVTPGQYREKMRKETNTAY